MFIAVIGSFVLVGCTSPTPKEKSFFQGNLLYLSRSAPRYMPCGVSADPKTRVEGYPVVGADRLGKFASANHVFLCDSCGYHFECRGAIVRVNHRMTFRIDEVLELRNHRPGDCDTEPKQD